MILLLGLERGEGRAFDCIVQIRRVAAKWRETMSI
jgi:hypothetical protein